MSVDRKRVDLAFALAAAATAWPSVLCATTHALATPLERALQSSWCGAGPQDLLMFGHCAACWSGAAAFLLAAMAVIAWPSKARLGRKA